MLDVPQLTADEILGRVLHRDGLMLVIDKPAGLPVHRGPKGGANLEDSFHALQFGLPRPPVLAHRLDKDTSGCLVLGRHRKATASLGLLFKHGKIGKPVADECTRRWWVPPVTGSLASQVSTSPQPITIQYEIAFWTTRSG